MSHFNLLYSYSNSIALLIAMEDVQAEDEMMEKPNLLFLHNHNTTEKEKGEKNTILLYTNSFFGFFLVFFFFW